MARPGYRKFHGFKSTVFGKNIPCKHLLDYAQARELAAEFTTLVEDGGIGLLIGEVGIGKTTAIRAFKCRGGNPWPSHATAVVRFP